MQQLVYASAASEAFPPHVLRALLERARSRNQVYSVTGMLLFHQDSFLQILEGPKEGVDLIYRSIEKDPRHRRPKVLLRQSLQRREFADWSMGFIDTASWGAARPSGMLDYARLASERKDLPSAAGKYLQFFLDGLCRQA